MEKAFDLGREPVARDRPQMPPRKAHEETLERRVARFRTSAGTTLLASFATWVLPFILPITWGLFAYVLFKRQRLSTRHPDLSEDHFAGMTREEVDEARQHDARAALYGNWRDANMYLMMAAVAHVLFLVAVVLFFVLLPELFRDLAAF